MKDNSTARVKSAGSRALLHGVDWAVESGIADEVMAETCRRVQRRRQRRRMAGATAAVVALVMVGTLWFSFDHHPAENPVATPTASSTAVVTLPASRVLTDGSVVELKPGAEIVVDFSGVLRRVVLKNGEAHFQVSKDKKRPFVVTAGSVDFRAVGTAFSVEMGARQIELLVTEGTVAVDKPMPASTASSPATPASVGFLATVDAGNRATVDVSDLSVVAAPVVQPVTPAEVDTRLAWRVPRLEFTQTPLAEAILMINQRSKEKLVLVDPALAIVRISGTLRADNIDTLLHLLEAEHGITAERRADGQVILKGR